MEICLRVCQDLTQLRQASEQQGSHGPFAPIHVTGHFGLGTTLQMVPLHGLALVRR